MTVDCAVVHRTWIVVQAREQLVAGKGVARRGRQNFQQAKFHRRELQQLALVIRTVGIGVDPTMTSFGTMINNARMELGREPVVWWSLLAAFVFMFVLVLAANLLADAVRDAFDPRMS